MGNPFLWKRAMHTVYVEKGLESAWLVQEDKPTCEYFPVSYSDMNLENWDQSKLYIPIPVDKAKYYIGDLEYKKYLKQNN